MFNMYLSKKGRNLSLFVERILVIVFILNE